MENKIKALFFAQYLNQKVLYGSVLKNASLIADKFGFLDFDNPEYYLLLRDISQLTDEEAAILVGLAMYHPDIEEYDPKECGAGDGDYNLDGSWWIEASCRCWDGTLACTPSFTFSLIDDNDKVDPVYNQIACTDYLRSIGILLPFTHLNEENKPITLTPSELISRGWCKIKDND